MNRKLRMDFVIKCKNKSSEHKLVLYGRSIGFGRIIDNLMDFRKLLVSYYEDEPHVKEILNYEEQDVPESPYTSEIFFDSCYVNSRKKFVANLFMPKVDISTFYSSINKFLKRVENRRDLSDKILKEVGERYNYREWGNELPLNGAIDILFNKYQGYLK